MVGGRRFEAPANAIMPPSTMPWKAGEDRPPAGDGETVDRRQRGDAAEFGGEGVGVEGADRAPLVYLIAGAVVGSASYSAGRGFFG